MNSNGLIHNGVSIETTFVSSGQPCAKPSIYLYPITPYALRTESNNYILKVKEYLGESFIIVNSVTKLGVLDILFKLPKTDIIYFNWIADLPDKRLGYIQIPVLALILILCKIFNKKIVWFIHNDVSHSRKNWLAKKGIRRMMMLFADTILAHSAECSLKKKISNIRVFDHPMEEIKTVATKKYKYDILIWGSVSPYKGVIDFLKYNYLQKGLQNVDILVAGKFLSLKLYRKACSYLKPNLQLMNNAPTDEELNKLFSESRYILFCYQSKSVLSSAALCKSISAGKTVIGPNMGAFKELGEKGLIYTYNSFEDVPGLMQRLKATDTYIDPVKLKTYSEQTSWVEFKNFLVDVLHSVNPKQPTMAKV